MLEIHTCSPCYFISFLLPKHNLSASAPTFFYLLFQFIAALAYIDRTGRERVRENSGAIREFFATFFSLYFLQLPVRGKVKKKTCANEFSACCRHNA